MLLSSLLCYLNLIKETCEPFQAKNSLQSFFRGYHSLQKFIFFHQIETENVGLEHDLLYMCQKRLYQLHGVCKIEILCIENNDIIVGLRLDQIGALQHT